MELSSYFAHHLRAQLQAIRRLGPRGELRGGSDAPLLAAMTVARQRCEQHFATRIDDAHLAALVAAAVTDLAPSTGAPSVSAGDPLLLHRCREALRQREAAGEAKQGDEADAALSVGRAEELVLTQAPTAAQVAAVRAVLDAAAFDSAELLRRLAAQPGVGALLREWVEVDDLSVLAHAERVYAVHREQRPYFDLDSIAAPPGVDLERTLRFVIALHDLGKPVAMERDGNKLSQHTYNAALVEALMRGYGFSAAEIAVGRALAGQDLLAPLLHDDTPETRRQVEARLAELAAEWQMSPRDTLLLLLFFTTIDAASYPELRHSAFALTPFGKLCHKATGVRDLTRGLLPQWPFDDAAQQRTLGQRNQRVTAFAVTREDGRVEEVTGLLGPAPCLVDPPGAPLPRADLEHELTQTLARVPDFVHLRDLAESRGLRLYLVGDSAAELAHYCRHALHERGGADRFRRGCFDGDFSNIFLQAQPLHLAACARGGGPADPARLEGLRQDIAGLLRFCWGQPFTLVDLAQQAPPAPGAGSHGAPRLELTAGARAGQDRVGQTAPAPFLDDVARGRLDLVLRAAGRSRDPALQPIAQLITYLTALYRYDLAMPPASLARARRVAAAFDPERCRDQGLRAWIETHGRALFEQALSVERAWNGLEELGLRAKLIALDSDLAHEGSLACLLAREPLRTTPHAGEHDYVATLPHGDWAFAHTGPSAAELCLDAVTHNTRSFEAYERMIRLRHGSTFISRRAHTGESALFGDGFYAALGDRGTQQGGWHIHLQVDPTAKLGNGFMLSPHLLLRNALPIEVAPEQLDMSPAQAVDFLRVDANRQQAGLARRLQRRLAGVEERAALEAFAARARTVLTEPSAEALAAVFAVPQSLRFPELLEPLLIDPRTVAQLAETVFCHQAWRRHPRASAWAADLLARLEAAPGQPALIHLLAQLPLEGLSDRLRAFVEAHLDDPEAKPAIARDLLPLPLWGERTAHRWARRLAEGCTGAAAVEVGRALARAGDAASAELLLQLATRLDAEAQGPPADQQKRGVLERLLAASAPLLLEAGAAAALTRLVDGALRVSARSATRELTPGLRVSCSSLLPLLARELAADPRALDHEALLLRVLDSDDTNAAEWLVKRGCAHPQIALHPRLLERIVARCLADRTEVEVHIEMKPYRGSALRAELIEQFALPHMALRLDLLCDLIERVDPFCRITLERNVLPVCPLAPEVRQVLADAARCDDADRRQEALQALRQTKPARAG